MTTTTTRYLALDAKTQWNMTVLHLIGHPIPVAVWYDLQNLYDAGYSPEEVAGQAGQPVYSRTTFDPFDGFEYPKD